MPKQYFLAGPEGAIGIPVTIQGGDYVLRVEAADFAGATVALEYRSLDGGTWYPALLADGVTEVEFTATGSLALGIGHNTVVRLVATGGTPAGLAAALGSLS